MSWGSARTDSEGHAGERIPASAARDLVEDWRFSDAEVHYLWWFIRDSIMVPDVQWRLRRAWGLCDRHAWGALLGEASYRHGYLHGPVMLYEDLIERARDALDVRGPGQPRRAARRLRDRGPCLMCEMDLRSKRAAAVRDDVLRDGRDPRALRRVWGRQGTDRVEDRAALLSAAGWCSGWRRLIVALGGGPRPSRRLRAEACGEGAS